MILNAVAESEVFRPDVTVATVVRQGDRFLMVEERVRGILVLNQPAGHLESGESLATAAVRETLEETAWEVALIGLLGVYQWRAPDGSEFLRFLFSAEPLQHHPLRALDKGIERALWLTVDELRQRQGEWRSPLVMRAVEDSLILPSNPLQLLNRVE